MPIAATKNKQFQQENTNNKHISRSVWIDPAGVEVICSLLSPNVSVLEYGAGGSTTFFSQFVKTWVSIEHNTKWAKDVTNILAKLPWGDKVKVHTVLPDIPFKEGWAEGTEQQFLSYINYPSTLGHRYDLVIDDGRARVPVSKAVLVHKLLASNESKLVIHDWERGAYKAMVKELGYRIDRQDVRSRRHLASLSPPQDYHV